MTFLELCQRTAVECGITRSLSAVTGQSGRMLDVVNWVNTAWEMIQNKHPNWHFMRSGFTLNTIAADGDYPPDEFTDTRSTALISNFSSWILDSFKIYDSTVGVAEQAPFRHIGYPRFIDHYRTGAVATNRPAAFTVRPYDSAILLGPAPNGIFVLTGEYWRAASAMAANGDEPGMPAQFHMAIVWQAVQLYAMNEEAPTLIATSGNSLATYMSRLENNQLPEIEFGAPLV